MAKNAHQSPNNAKYRSTLLVVPLPQLMEVPENESPPYFDPPSALKPSLTENFSKSNSKGFLQCFPYMVVQRKQFSQTWFQSARWVEIWFGFVFWHLHQLGERQDQQYMPIFFVVWVLVRFFAIIRSSADSFINPLVIPQIRKNRSVLSPLCHQVEPVIRGLFRRFGYRLTSIFFRIQKKQ